MSQLQIKKRSKAKQQLSIDKQFELDVYDRLIELEIPRASYSFNEIERQLSQRFESEARMNMRLKTIIQLIAVRKRHNQPEPSADLLEKLTNEYHFITRRPDLEQKSLQRKRMQILTA